MRKHLPLLLLLLAVGLGYWLLASEQDAPAARDWGLGPDDGGVGDVAPPDAAKPIELDIDPEVAKRKGRKRPRRVYQPTDPRTLPTGVDSSSPGTQLRQ